MEDEKERKRRRFYAFASLWDSGCLRPIADVPARAKPAVMLARVILMVAAGLAATSVSAQVFENSISGSNDVIYGAWSDPTKCNRANAARMTLDEIIARGEKLNGTCVAVEGFWASHALFKSESQGNKVRSNVARYLRNHRIGIYACNEVLENAPRRSTRYTMVGVIGQCETEWPNVMMVLGYCHYTGGPILKVAEAVLLPTPNGSLPPTSRLVTPGGTFGTERPR